MSNKFEVDGAKIEMFILLHGYGNLRRVVFIEPYPSGLCRLRKQAANLDSLSGKNGDVIVVVFEGKELVTVFGIGDDGALEKRDVFGRVV